MKHTTRRTVSQIRSAAVAFVLGVAVINGGCGGTGGSGPSGPDADGVDTESPGSGTGSDLSNSYFSAEVNGRTFHWVWGNLADRASGVLYNEQLFIDCILYDGTVQFEDESIGFGLHGGFMGAGTYAVGSGTNFGQYLRDGGDLVERADSGYFTIEPYGPGDATIAGAFEFVFTLPDEGELRVTNGRYRVPKHFGD